VAAATGTDDGGGTLVQLGFGFEAKLAWRDVGGASKLI
jgi:hypothetical protein